MMNRDKIGTVYYLPIQEDPLNNCKIPASLNIAYYGLPTSKNIEKQRGGGGKMRWPEEVIGFQNSFIMLGLQHNHDKEIQLFLNEYNKATEPAIKNNIRVKMIIHSHTERGDNQNFIDHLSDGLQGMLGVDDKNFLFTVIERQYIPEGYEKTVLVLTIEPNTFHQQKMVYKALQKMNKVCKDIKPAGGIIGQ